MRLAFVAVALFPYIQTHVFDLRPLVPEVKRGYALFIASGSFDGGEQVAVFPPDGGAFPAGQRAMVLTEYERRGEWRQPQRERVASALSGPLGMGSYRFVVARADGGAVAEQDVVYDGRFLAPPTGIDVTEAADGTRLIRWTAPASAQSFLVFLVPEGSTDVLQDLISISHPDHPAATLALARGLVAPGRYRVAVRANQHLLKGVPGYARESWGMSQKAYLFD